MLDNITEQELVQNSRIFYEPFLPGAVTRLRNQALSTLHRPFKCLTKRLA